MPEAEGGKNAGGGGRVGLYVCQGCMGTDRGKGVKIVKGGRVSKLRVIAILFLQSCQ